MAVVDLSAAYPQVNRALRGIELLDRRRVIVQDELDGDKPVDVVWNFHTMATAQLNAAGDTAALQNEGASQTARILSPPGAKFVPISVNIPPPQKPAHDVSNLTIRLPQKITQTRIVVEFDADTSATPEPISPLADWIAAAGK